MTAALTADHVTKRYGDTAVVSEASLELKPGTLTALLGPSGAGKSTLLRILAGLESLDSGTVRLGDTVLSSTARMVPAEKRRTGLIFQDYALFPHLTALGNILFGLAHLPRAEAIQRARNWLDRLTLNDRADAYPHQLSGGEQQRVAIARALAPDPDAILMDEPFSGLDPALEAGVREAAMRALADAGKPALLVTHDPEAAMTMAHQLAVMRGGRILQAGPPETVYKYPVDLGVARALGPLEELDPSTCPPSLLAGFDLPEKALALGFRPEDVRIDGQTNGPTSGEAPQAQATLARVEEVTFLGMARRIALRIETGAANMRLTALSPGSDPAPAIGDRVPVRLVPQGRFIFEL